MRIREKRVYPMKQRHYNAGDIILKEGDPSDFAYKIVSGEVEVFTDFEGQTVILGVMKAGEFLGEMGIVDGQPRSASARARKKATLMIFERKEFLRLICKDSSSAYRMITRLCEQLRSISRRLAGSTGTMKPGDTAGGKASVREPQATSAYISSKSESTNFRFTVSTVSPQLGPHIPKEGITVTKLPFSVGRLLPRKGPELFMPIDLRLPDSRPFRLSRQHFALYQGQDGCGVLDLGSTLGTEINGEFLGRDFGKDFEYLKPGKNRIVAGGVDSPFAFTVLMEPV